MAQHQSVDPMTPEQRADYAVRCRILAAKQRLEGDLVSADLNEWMAGNYERPPSTVPMKRINISTEATYDADLAAVNASLSDRLASAIAEDDSLRDQLPKWLSDALNDEWHDGIDIEDWVERAASRAGI